MVHPRSVWSVLLLFGCIGASEVLAQVCQFEDAQHCQLFDDSLNFVQSDRDFERSGDLKVASDDFVSTQSTLNRVCVWGFYIDQDPDAPDDDCGPAAVDHFVVRVFYNDPDNGREPENQRGSSVATSHRVVLPNSQIETALGNQVYEYSLVLDNPINNLTPGQVFWLEVYNDVDDAVSPTCAWQWSQKAQTSTSYSFRGGLEIPFDNAFCTNFALGQSPVGAMPGACCMCGGICSEQTLADCSNVGGIWHIDNATCEGVTCSSVPVNDECPNATPITEGAHTFGHECAGTDGYGPIATETGQWQIERDVWYTFVAPENCQLTIRTCESPTTLDPVLAVYHNPDDPTTCPPCALLNDPNGALVSQATLAGLGQDNSCPNRPLSNSSGGVWMDTEQMGRSTLPGECFLIRVGGFPGGPDEIPYGTLSVACHDEGTPVPLEPDPSGINKTRFISFHAPPQNTSVGETAIRINMTSLHIPIPPFGEMPALCCLAFQGKWVYVGPSVTHLESSAGGAQFQASNTQCTPYYQDWSTVGLLHVTGPHIVPSSTYHLEQLAASCEGREDDFHCLPAGGEVSPQLEIKTTRWGDVAALFNPPHTSVQPDISDVSALVDKFRSAPGAPIKARSILAGIPGNPWGDITVELLSADFGFSQISACVDAFRGVPYPYLMGKCAGAAAPPATGACRYNSECTGNNGSGPCNLYCP